MTCIPSEQYRIALRQYVGSHDVDCLCESKPIIVKKHLELDFGPKASVFKHFLTFKIIKFQAHLKEVEPYSLRLFDDLTI